MGKTDYSAVGMAYLEPRIKDKELMPCIGYVFFDPLKDKHEEDSFIECLPENGGPCICGYGFVKNFKPWAGGYEHPKCYSQIVRPNMFAEEEAEEKFQNWVKSLITEYPQVKYVKLFGSRANGTAKPGSDWDVLIELVEWCNFDDVAKKISLDNANNVFIADFRTDLWLLRPDGLVTRDHKVTYLRPIESYLGFRHNWLIPNLRPQESCCKNWFSRIYEDIQNAKVIFQKEGA